MRDQTAALAMQHGPMEVDLSLDGTSPGFNDSWTDDPSLPNLPVAIRPSCNAEAAITLTLPPGAYTAIVSDAGGSTGFGIVEAFAVEQGWRSVQSVAGRTAPVHRT